MCWSLLLLLLSPPSPSVPSSFSLLPGLPVLYLGLRAAALNIADADRSGAVGMVRARCSVSSSVGCRGRRKRCGGWSASLSTQRVSKGQTDGPVGPSSRSLAAPRRQTGLSRRRRRRSSLFSSSRGCILARPEPVTVAGRCSPLASARWFGRLARAEET